MKVSVIVATKNEQNDIQRLLQSIKDQTFNDLEIIVIDNFSTDKTVEIAKRYTTKVFSTGPERSSQRNFGLKHAKGKDVLFVDADMELDKNLVLECVNKLEKNQNLSGLIINEVSVGAYFLARVKNLEKQIYRNVSEIEAARFFRKEQVEKIAGYDNKLIAGEDWDLSQRMKKLGNFEHVKSKIKHYESGSFWQDIVKKYYYAKNIYEYASINKQIWQKQSGKFRFLILFSKPKLVFSNPIEFLGLISLKLSQYCAYMIARFFYS